MKLRQYRPIPVTVVVPVKNEEQSLGRCLASLTRFEHVIVVDSRSTDRTVDIAIEYGAEVLQFSWDGKFPKKRNWLLLNYAFTTRWVLFLDADEICSDALCDELNLKLAQSDAAGYWITYTNAFLGRRLRFGVPQRKLALIRVGSGLYEQIDENYWTDLDMEIHEHPLLKGKLEHLAATIEHVDPSGLVKFVERHKNYAIWEARRYRLIHARGDYSALTTRQRKKYDYLARWWFPWCYFLFTYVCRLGFLDGSAGFLYAFYKLWYFETVRQLIIENDRETTATQFSQA